MQAIPLSNRSNFARSLIRWFVALTGLCILMVAGLTAFLHAWVVPNIDSLRSRIETYASEKLSVPVRISQINATTDNWMPTFILQGVQIPELKLQRIEIAVSAISLLQWDIDRIVIDKPELHVQRDAQGMWSIGSLKFSGSDPNGSALDWLLEQKNISINQGRLRITNEFAKKFDETFESLQLNLSNGFRTHRLTASMQLQNASAQSVTGVASFSQPLLQPRAGNWRTWSGNITAKLQSPNIASLVQLFPDSPWANALPAFGQIKQLELDSNFSKGMFQSLDARIQNAISLFDVLTVHLEPTPINPLALLTMQAQEVQLSGIQKIAALLKIELPRLPSPIEGKLSTLSIKAQNLLTDKATVEAKVHLSSDYANGQIQAQWQASKVDGGVLDLNSQFKQIDLVKLIRWMPDQAPSWLKKGILNNVQLTINGGIQSIFFQSDAPYDLKISGALADGSIELPTKEVWPQFTQMKGDLYIDHKSLELKNIRTQFASLALHGELKIPNLKRPELEISAESKNTLQQFIRVINETPLTKPKPGIFAQASGTGLAQVQAQFRIPLATTDLTKVQGQLHLLGEGFNQGNRFTLNPSIPVLTNARGGIAFTESGFTLNQLQGQFLGGEMNLSGNQNEIRGEGTINIEGLLGSQWRNQVQGYTAYQFQAKSNQIFIQSDLENVQINLPYPFDKPAAAKWPLDAAYEFSTSPSVQDRLQLTLNNFIQIDGSLSIKDALPIIEKMNIGIGEKIQAPTKGIHVQVLLPELDLAIWQKALSTISSGANANDNLPTSLSAKIDRLQWDQRQLQNVSLNAIREANAWKANVAANQLAGQIEYRGNVGQNLGQLYARLSRLTIPDAQSKTQVEQFLSEQPDAIPALDVVVEDFEVAGKKLGKLEIQAVNQRATSNLSNRLGQEWRLNTLNIVNPQATLKASGVWSALEIDAKTRRVDLQFNYEIADSGELLKRFGVPDAVAGGKGIIQGRLGWLGSPLGFHYPSLTGQLKVDMAQGQFLKIDPGVGRLLSVLSLQSLPRRLKLDFRDVFSEGFAFDSLVGDAQVKEGIASTQNLQMKSVLALISMEGYVDLSKETQNLRVLVLPDINAGGASLLAAIINPIVGAATYLAQLILRRPAVAAATKEFKIEGTWQDPKVTQITR
jgi:uncharacterized protein (TIGR02099 family)